MLELTVVQGSQANFVLSAVNRDGSTPTGFLSSDTLTGTVWAGQGQTSLFSPTVTWSNYATAEVAVQFAGTQTTALDYAGVYHLQIFATRSSTTVCIIDVLLKILPSASTGTDLVTPYCAYTDLLEVAPWITLCQDDNADQESFYTQRLNAKKWLDWLIVKSWRGTSAAYFGDAGRSAQFWLGSWVRRTPLPSYWLTNQLSGGIVQQNPTITAPGSGYTYANLVFSGGGAPTAGQASGTCVCSGGQVISGTITNPGYGYTSTPTVTVVGNGTGATCTCTISQQVLILREQIKRACAYKAASFIGLGQIGRQNTIASHGALFRDWATAEIDGVVAELDLNGDGIADLPIPISVSNTMFT